ncbi:hypothetical protein sphantq_02957 [Sphingobium sp. AntQ-1]|uniref:hypothetical protein n=1 Tax=Sphingobium sp. AntQ-1 TaxID=2930091 RepID=UPI00234F6303|nr:hypothetical protein [Sphingobium sp. AntQ-1]WCP14511.1 hypothetical protein sphantq_02957 [Sphingobium sp. AntQ-1]
MAERLGDILPRIIARAESMASFQALINECGTAARRKEMIMTAKIGGLIDCDECRMLIETYGLETA